MKFILRSKINSFVLGCLLSLVLSLGSWVRWSQGSRLCCLQMMGSYDPERSQSGHFVLHMRQSFAALDPTHVVDLKRSESWAAALCHWSFKPSCFLYRKCWVQLKLHVFIFILIEVCCKWSKVPVLRRVHLINDVKSFPLSSMDDLSSVSLCVRGLWILCWLKQQGVD